MTQAAPDAPKVWARRFHPQPDRRESAHVHQFFEILYLESGRGHHLIDGERFELEEGDLCWMRPGQHHDPAGLATTRKWILAFNAEAAVPGHPDGQFFGGSPAIALTPFAPLATTRRQLRLPAPARACWVERLEAIARELEEQPLGFGEAACAHLRLLLLELARLAGASSESTGGPLLAEVFAFIEARFREPIGLRDVAEAVGLSPAYLTDRVRRETGRTVLQWVIDRRLAEARRLLLQSEAPVLQIAQEVGYLDAKHFTAQFRRAHGRSPHAWRTLRLGGATGKSA